MPVLVGLLLLALDGAARAAPVPTFQELEESLTCQCGCGLTVHACNHLQCPSAIPLRDEIRAQMAKRLDRTAILAHFEATYGEKILSSPTTRGFNLAAWTTPFVILFLGTAFVLVTLWRWQRTGARRQPPDASPVPPSGAPAGADLRRQLERELRDLDA